MVCVFHKHGLETNLLKTLPARFQSRFKTVQREQMQIHETLGAARRKRARCQKFFVGLIADFNLANCYNCPHVKMGKLGAVLKVDDRKLGLKERYVVP